MEAIAAAPVVVEAAAVAAAEPVEAPAVEAAEAVAPAAPIAHVETEIEAEAVIVDTATTEASAATANPFSTNEVAVDVVEDALPPVDEATATAAVEVEPVAADANSVMETVAVDEAPEVVVARHVEPAVEAPAQVEATVEGDATAATAAATEASPADDEATRRAEQLRGLFQTARHDAANAPLAQDEAAGEAIRGA